MLRARSRNGSRCARITFKVRRGNDLVDFEPFLRSQTLYPTELRARSQTLHCQQFTASSSSISTSSVGSFRALVRTRWCVIYLIRNNLNKLTSWMSLWRSARYSAGIDRVSATESSLVMERPMGIETASPHFYVSAAEDVTGRTPIQLLEMLESDLPWHFFETEAKKSACKLSSFRQ